MAFPRIFPPSQGARHWDLFRGAKRGGCRAAGGGPPGGGWATCLGREASSAWQGWNFLGRSVVIS